MRDSIFWERVIWQLPGRSDIEGCVSYFGGMPMMLLSRWLELLQGTDWPFEFHPDLGRITLRVEAEDVYLVDLCTQQDLRVVIAIMADKQKVNPDNRDRMLVFMNRANFQFTLGGFEMDPDDGAIRFRTPSTPIRSSCPASSSKASSAHSQSSDPNTGRQSK
jgi:hypothetical protein